MRPVIECDVPLLARYVAEALQKQGAGAWTVQGTHHGDHFAMLVRGDLALSFYKAPTDKCVRITAQHVNSKATHETLRYNESAPSIGVSCDRASPTFAAEIRRRLLDDAIALVTRVQARIAMNERHADGVAHTARTLADALGVEVMWGDEKASARIAFTLPSDATAFVEVSGRDVVKLSVHLSGADAAAVLNLLRERQAVKP